MSVRLPALLGSISGWSPSNGKPEVIPGNENQWPQRVSIALREGSFHVSFWVANPLGGAVDVDMWNECIRARHEQEDLG